jgi:hypothetical protein
VVCGISHAKIHVFAPLNHFSHELLLFLIFEHQARPLPTAAYTGVPGSADPSEPTAPQRQPWPLTPPPAADPAFYINKHKFL